jgi:glutathione synthase/RimK-type ligase-like ATP-grasp enzyme
MILCLSHTKDFYTIDIVQRRLNELGHKTFRLNADQFSHQVTFSYSGKEYPFSFELHAGNERFSSREVKAVWYRKLWSITPPEDLSPAYRPVFFQEYETMRDIFLDSLRHVPWMNPMNQDHWIGGNKVMQLELAQKNGLQVVPSLFTNDPERARRFFYEQCNGQMVGKLHGTLSRSMAGNTPSFPTTRIQEEDLDQLDSLAYCPMIFQQYIPKDYELRIAYVDGVVYAGKIDASTSARGNTDWRIATDIPLQWQPYHLPEEVVRGLTAMMKEMNLFFGAIDMIRHQDGRYIFLEVNPQGEWGMLQRDIGYPIGETIAERLVARIVE